MDASLYNADNFTVRNVAYLSQRDLSISIPVNFVTQPGVALTAACFADRKYQDAPGTRCMKIGNFNGAEGISNLLKAGFRRLEIDVYWDASRSQWSLCPVELGNSDQVLTTSKSHSPTATAVPLAPRSMSDQLTAQSAATSLSSVSIANPSSTSTLGAGGVSTAAGSTATSAPHVDGTAIQIGGFTCTSTMDFELLLMVVSGRLTETATDLNATTIVMTLNIHAAAPASAPSGSPQQPADGLLPSSDNSLSSIIARNISERVYTPTNLLSERANLNISQSWFNVNPAEQPNPAYFRVDTSRTGSSSPDGWPSEAYVEIAWTKRLLIQYGRIDPQMVDYDLSMESSTIFPSGYLNEPTRATISSNGTIASGCFFAPGVTTIAERNNSWAIQSIGEGTVSQDESSQLFVLAKSLTDCGISPVLNETLNFTADKSYAPYLAYVDSTIWTWGPDQPTNSSVKNDMNDYRCAALNATSGMWLASDCGSTRYGACRVSNHPYQWKITYDSAPYDRIHLACDDGSAFDVPRTSLENAHLLSTWRSYVANQDDDSGSLLWLDFNQLDVSGCWVIGSNSTCPYVNKPGSEDRRIIVPVVGAIVVFVLAALTVLIKCAGNRQTAKRRKRRGNDGWDYEGVPS